MKAVFLRCLTISGMLSWLLLSAVGLAQPAAGQAVVNATASMGILPGGILPDSPLAQVIKLVQAGVDVGIIQTFITNSTSTFNLDADKIITLKDVGAPNDLAPLMMQHDRLLQAQIAAATPAPTAPPAAPMPSLAPAVADDLQAGDVTAAPTVTVNYFYNLLAPYGNWVAIDGYGRCWQPGVAVYHPDWQPYGDHGHWVYTDSGWYWVSDYSWGWVPFHYGRWLHDASLGWCWCPDTVWGPSWVTWRCSDEYCGWAPLPPGSEYVDGSGFVYDGSIVAPDYDFGLAPDTFIFVTVQDFCDPHPTRHRIDRGRVPAIYHQTIAINRYDRDDRHGFINNGIDPARITRVTHLPIRPLVVHETPASVGLYGHGEAVQGTAMVVNHPQFRDNQPNLSVAWNQNQTPAANPLAPPGALAPSVNPGPDQRPDGGGGYFAPAPLRYENNYHPPARPEPLREAVPLPEVRPEPARLEPTRLEPPTPREEPKPVAEPAHNSPAPAEAKSDKDSGKKSGGH
jgi:hypothetical protein